LQQRALLDSRARNPLPDHAQRVFETQYCWRQPPRSPASLGTLTQAYSRQYKPYATPVPVSEVLCDIAGNARGSVPWGPEPETLQET